jgi:hypothetical protein
MVCTQKSPLSPWVGLIALHFFSTGWSGYTPVTWLSSSFLVQAWDRLWQSLSRILYDNFRKVVSIHIKLDVQVQSNFFFYL